MTLSRTIPLALIPIAVALGCGERADRPQSTAPSVARLDLSGPPLASLSAGDSAPLYEVVGGVLLPGAVVLAEGSSHSLKFYDRTGALRRVVGRKGNGPGEFEQITWIQLTGERLWLFDKSQDRLSEFTLSGEFVESTLISSLPSVGSASLLGVVGERDLLLAVATAAGATDIQGVQRARGSTFRRRHSGEVDTLFSGLSSENFSIATANGGAMGPPIFGAETKIAMHGDQIFQIENVSPVVAVYSLDGAPERELRPPGLTRDAVRPGDAERARARQSGLVARHPKFRSLLDRLPVRDSFPFFGWTGEQTIPPMRAMSSGRLWVLAYSGAHSDAMRWFVYSLSGELVCEVRTESAVDVLDELDETLLVKWWNALGEEQLELRRLNCSSR